MGGALEISRGFCEEVVLPVLRARHGDLVDVVAVGVAGTGSDVLGLDDDISRDHHWGPRAAVLLPDEHANRVGEIRATLAGKLPDAYQGYKVHLDPDNRTGVCVDHLSSYLHWFLGTSRLPEADEDWFGLCETDLLHVTAGEVFHDPGGWWTAVRERLAYYPDRVWRKRVADWCMYVTGRDAPYNLHRVSRRGDEVASQIYFGQTIRRMLELGFAIEKRYAPYPKWQHRLFRRVGGCSGQVLSILERVLEETHWSKRVEGLIEINHVYAHRLAELGLTSPPKIQPFDESLTDLTLYASATELYAKLPPEWLTRSFNPIESWEKMARLVLFDAQDYFREKFRAELGDYSI